MGTQFAVVYATVSNLILRKIDTTGDPDDSAIARVQARLAPGEAVKILKLADFPKRDNETLQGQIGPLAHSGRCAVVDPKTAKVVNVCVAEPTLYQPPNDNLIIQHDMAATGWDYAAGKLTTRLAVVVAGSVVQVVNDDPLTFVPTQPGALVVADAVVKVGDPLPLAGPLAVAAAPL